MNKQTGYNCTRRRILCRILLYNCTRRRIMPDSVDSWRLGGMPVSSCLASHYIIKPRVEEDAAALAGIMQRWRMLDAEAWICDGSLLIMYPSRWNLRRHENIIYDDIETLILLLAEHISPSLVHCTRTHLICIWLLLLASLSSPLVLSSTSSSFIIIILTSSCSPLLQLNLHPPSFSSFLFSLPLPSLSPNYFKLYPPSSITHASSSSSSLSSSSTMLKSSASSSLSSSLSSSSSRQSRHGDYMLITYNRGWILVKIVKFVNKSQSEFGSGRQMDGHAPYSRTPKNGMGGQVFSWVPVNLYDAL